LDGVASLLPDIGLFLCAYVGKEAALSSRIEGTESSLSDLLPFELGDVPGVPLDDGIEVLATWRLSATASRDFVGAFPYRIDGFGKFIRSRFPTGEAAIKNQEGSGALKTGFRGLVPETRRMSSAAGTRCRCPGERRMNS